jgi:catechol 2,3-dioxygenase-like lactoylglutathione lyase family enzyme
MLRISALDHFVLRVTDLDRSLAFYGDVLGLGILFADEYRRGERPFVSARIGDQLLDLIPDPTFDPAEAATKGGFVHFCARFKGADFEPLIRYLAERGVDILGGEPVPRMGAAGVSRSIYVRDPDGYVIELKEG